MARTLPFHETGAQNTRCRQVISAMRGANNKNMQMHAQRELCCLDEHVSAIYAAFPPREQTLLGRHATCFLFW